MGDLRSIKGVELVKTGTHDASTGTWTVTPGQLRSALAAHEANVLGKPVVKIGHDDERFDGQPSFGYVDNLKLADDDHTLLGDFLALPAWLADAIPNHWPRRSVEAAVDVEAKDGTTYPLVLTGVALLGAVAPAITDLASLQQVIAAKRVTISAAHRVVDHRRAVTIAAARRRRAHRKVTTT